MPLLLVPRPCVLVVHDDDGGDDAGKSPPDGTICAAPFSPRPRHGGERRSLPEASAGSLRIVVVVAVGRCGCLATEFMVLGGAPT